MKEPALQGIGNRAKYLIAIFALSAPNRATGTADPKIGAASRTPQTVKPTAQRTSGKGEASVLSTQRLSNEKANQTYRHQEEAQGHLPQG
jgi:hypothetical protein